MVLEPETRPAPAAKPPLAAMEARKILATWLSEHPDALVAAISSNGMPAALPDSLPLPGFRREERSVLDLVDGGDTRAVTEGFISALDLGINVTSVHLASDPDQTVLVHYLDLREEFGVLLRLLVAADRDSSDTAGGVSLSPAELGSTRPRLGFMTKDEVATIVSVDEATTLMLGWPPGEMVGRRSIDFIHPEDHVRAIDNWMARRSNPATRVGTVRLRHLCHDGSWLWLETSNEFVDRGDSTVVNTQIIDISSEMAAGEALRRSEALLRRVTDTVPVGMFHISSNGAVVFVNPVAERLLGGRVPESRSQLCALLARDRVAELDAAVVRVLEEGIEAYIDLEIASDANEPRSCQVTLRPVLDQDRTAGVLGCIVDVTELKHMADTDTLTGVESRRSIMAILAHELTARDGVVAAVYVDLDHFKPVNDRYGHALGDDALIAFAERLRGGIRAHDRIGRLGGDEFLVVCPGVANEAEGLEIARRMREELDHPLELHGRILRVTASLGVSCGREGMSADEVVALADAAMYQAKHERGGPPILLPIREAG
jgi:diguanylate cyclase (GGDEF)-like protein/PAS domain S-box-containing protein